MERILVMIGVQIIREEKRNIADRNSRGPDNNYNECIWMFVLQYILLMQICSVAPFLASFLLGCCILVNML